MTDPKIIAFASPEKWQQWLAKNHGRQEGIWMRIFKKGSGVKSITYPEAVDESLCYGWIDGQKKSYDTHSWLQKFTPRRPKSIWSKMNTLHVQRLIKAGKMQPVGLAAVTAAQKDGRWANAYHSPKTMTLPDDFFKALKKNKRAAAFFKTLDKRNTYAMAYRLASAKRLETRQERLKKFIDMLAHGRKLY